MKSENKYNYSIKHIFYNSKYENSNKNHNNNNK